MSLVDWTKILPSAKVVFSSLNLHEQRTRIDRAVAALNIGSGQMLDIQWQQDRGKPVGKYVVAIYRNDYDTLVRSAEATNPSDVVQLAIQMVAQRQKQVTVNRRAATATSDVVKVLDTVGRQMAYLQPTG